MRPTARDFIAKGHRVVRWVIGGWRVAGKSLREALGEEVGYRECLAYKLMERSYDDENDLAFARQENPDATHDELWEEVWETRNFWWEDASSIFWSKKEPEEDELLEAFYASWEDVDIEKVACPRCEGEIDWPCSCCSSCKAPTACCRGEYHDRPCCVSCGHDLDSLELMEDAVDAHGQP